MDKTQTGTPAPTEEPIYAQDAPAEVTAEQVSQAVAATRPPRPAEAARPRHPEYLLKQAGAVGVHPAVIAALTSDQLAQVVMDTLADARRQAGQASAAAAVTQRPPEAASAGPPAGQPSLAEEFDWGEYEDDDGDGKKAVKKVNPDDLHPALVALIRRQEKRISAMQAALSQQARQAQQAQERTVAQRFDAAFSKSPRLFGVGSAEAVKGTPEFARRSAVYAQVMSIPPEQRAGLTVEAAVAQVAQLLFGAGQQDRAVEAWNAGSVAVPTQRAGVEGPGRAKAVSSVEQYMREQQGQGGLFEETSPDEFLP